MATLPRFFLSLILLVAVLVPASTKARSAADFIADVEQAHGGAAWLAKKAIAFKIDLTMGKEQSQWRFLFTKEMGRIRAERSDGTAVVFDGEQTWIAPAAAEAPMAAFWAKTIPYFTLAPFKLRDPGTHLTLSGKKLLRGQQLETARLTFDKTAGETPDDWYILYKDPTGALAAMAYIVTYGKSPAEAAKEPHAITFEEPAKLGGVTLATKWRFWNWNEAEGITGEPLGEARLTELKFVKPDDKAFLKPQDARRDAGPPAK